VTDVPEWLALGNEGELRATIRFTDPHQPGVRCDACSHPDNTPWTRNVFHPAGRPCLSPAPPGECAMVSP